MSAFVPRATASTLAEPDPSKHVNYTLGMVLGVDDFKQEFAYLSGRDQWLARDLFGYGTASGLQVNIEVENNAPQVVVTPGVAVSPRGQTVRVAPAQCADLDAWVTTRREEVERRVGETKGNAAEARLFVTLCYRACTTDMVPVPGEPCRSADETVAASRVTDDFKLEIRFDPPAQREEDALREYAEWLGQIEIRESNDAPRLQEFEDVIRKMARGQGEGRGQQSLMTGPPPADLKLEARHVAKYLRTALNFWVTELRPRVQSWRPEIGGGLDAQTADKGEECVLLAELRVPLKRTGTSALWRVGEAKSIQVIEDRRPVVAHARMLQELLLGVGRAVNPKPPAYQVMAAGLVRGQEGSGGNEFNNLRVTKVGAGTVSMTFDGYEQPDPVKAPFQYIVKALLVLPANSALTQAAVTFSRFEATDTGFTLSVTNAGKAVDKAALANLSFMVEVSRYATEGKDNKESKEKDAKETKDTKESKEKDTKESKEKDTKESKEKDTKESKEKDTKETKEKDTKEGKEKDTKESKDTKDSKEKDTKESKEKDTKEGKEKDTKEGKEKDTKETKEKDTKEGKEKDTKETKEKDTKESKEKDTKETKEKGKEKDTKESKEKDTKESKEKEAAKDTKEAREEKANQDKVKDGAALKEIERMQPTQPDGLAFHGAAGDADATLATGRAFIRGEERPDVGRRALELADESEEAAKPEDAGKPVDAGKPGESAGKQ
ncbi:MAG TPA: hypothetical protein VF659_01980, partial [Pyrinomonadaceae bacterium]